jgi:hypothetical protein
VKKAFICEFAVEIDNKLIEIKVAMRKNRFWGNLLNALRRPEISVLRKTIITLLYRTGVTATIAVGGVSIVTFFSQTNNKISTIIHYRFTAGTRRFEPFKAAQTFGFVTFFTIRSWVASHTRS